MTTGELQQKLFLAIRQKMKPDASPAEEIAGLLQISTDSAYRRMRGEKTISLDELSVLCMHYQLSLDELMGLQKGSIVFRGEYLDKRNFKFEEYIRSVMQNVAYMNSFKDKRFYYLCKDLPIFHHYHLREIAAFKWFFWLKTYFEFPGFDIFAIEKKVLEFYNTLPSVEIWNLESMNIFFRQIDFYRDGQVFESDRDVYLLYEALGKLWDHLEKQAAFGYKFNYGDPEQQPLGKFSMYFNEVLLGDNNMLVEFDGMRMAYVSHTTINFMITKDVTFTDNLFQHIQNQIKRSTLISEVSEKERARFFRIIRERIEHRKESLKV
jgi:hypothetical protein